MCCVEACEPRDFMGLIYVESEFVLSKRRHIALAYFFHVEPLEIIGECQILIFMGSVAVNVNEMEA